MSKNGFIDNVSVGSPCTEDWNKMVGSDQVRMCGHCAKDVNNLSELTRKDAKRLVRASDGNICIRYMQHPVTRRPIFADQMYQITRRAPGITAGVITASMSLSTMAYAQGGAAPRDLDRGQTEVAIEKNRDGKPKNEKADNEVAKSFARVSGRVTDLQGAVIPNAVLVITNTLNKTETVASTNEDGQYEIDSVPPGTYDLRASYAGFKSSVRTGIEVAAGEVNVSDVQLEFGELIALGGVIAISRDYSTALARAVDNESTEDVRDLISDGANVNGKDANYENLTPIFIAVENGNFEITEMLLNSGAKINVRDKNKQTALMRLDANAKPELIDLLVRHGAKLNLSDNEGNTAIILASGGVSIEVLRALINAGADINLANKEGKTALMRAAEGGHLENVRLLLESGANVNARDKEGDTAWDYAEETSIEELLVSYGADARPDESETISDNDPKVVINR